MLEKILKYADTDQIKALATPTGSIYVRECNDRAKALAAEVVGLRPTLPRCLALPSTIQRNTQVRSIFLEDKIPNTCWSRKTSTYNPVGAQWEELV